MKNIDDFYFRSYQDWHHAITKRCNIKLTKDYARQRIEALQNINNPSTKDFVAKYGSVYTELVTGWFERAEKESS